ncbi:MAG: squalene-hopene/tetraprenyl-beta-curcumene cyclase [Pseudohongiellaceae bacterium]|jgi:squalene-hopene/tetraprenyl-beta-curcumene cyclase
MPLALACFLSAFITLGAATAQQDTKGEADSLVRRIRAEQNADWGYGTELLDTARVLDLLARSPRRYNELDGPFFRRAAELVAAAEPGALPDGWIALALASSVTPKLRAARDAALNRLVTAPLTNSDEAALLALRSQEELRVSWPDELPTLSASPPWLTLLASDPAQIEAPPTTEIELWARWARAAMLRGVLPATAPELPHVADDAALPELLNALSLVIVLHSLPKDAPPSFDPPPLPPKVEQPLPTERSLERALDWFESHQQLDSFAQQRGTFGLGLPGWDGPEPGITALCLSAVMGASEHLGREHPPWVATGLDFLASQAKDDGGIYDYGVKVYTTSVALEALLDGGREHDRPIIDRARQFLVDVQADGGEGYSSVDDPHYGGVGYGGDERPDLSNTQMALEAAHRAGEPADSPFFRKALAFLERSQNLGEITSHSWPRANGGTMVSGTDGGATYMPGNSPAGEDALGDGRYAARSYGSMTYALTKSFLICGLGPEDVRVSAAVNWLADHFTLETNPGFADPSQGSDGRYYYYLAMSRTLRLLGKDLVDSSGRALHWRSRLDGHLRAEQRTDGSWINEDSARWLEGAPSLCSAYAVLAMLGAQP